MNDEWPFSLTAIMLDFATEYIMQDSIRNTIRINIDCPEWRVFTWVHKLRREALPNDCKCPSQRESEKHAGFTRPLSFPAAADGRFSLCAQPRQESIRAELAGKDTDSEYDLHGGLKTPRTSVLPQYTRAGPCIPCFGRQRVNTAQVTEHDGILEGAAGRYR